MPFYNNIYGMLIGRLTQEVGQFPALDLSSQTATYSPPAGAFDPEKKQIQEVQETFASFTANGFAASGHGERREGGWHQEIHKLQQPGEEEAHQLGFKSQDSLMPLETQAEISQKLSRHPICLEQVPLLDEQILSRIKQASYQVGLGTSDGTTQPEPSTELSSDDKDWIPPLHPPLNRNLIVGVLKQELKFARTSHGSHSKWLQKSGEDEEPKGNKVEAMYMRIYGRLI